MYCRLYDCDFNQQLELGMVNRQRRTVFDIESLQDLTGGCWAARESAHTTMIDSISKQSMQPVWIIEDRVGTLCDEVSCCAVPCCAILRCAGEPIAVDSHCFGCTAGAGSGCQGATS